MCPNLGSKMAASLSRWATPLISDIVLIVTVNSAQVFTNVHRIEAVHRPVFRHIVYCGPQRDIFLEYVRNLGLEYEFTFIEIEKWWFYYKCVSGAMELNLTVKGYLTIGDDVLLNSWNIIELDRDRVWSPPGIGKLKLNGTGFGKNWVHFRKWYGGKAVNRTFSDLDKLAMSNSTAEDIGTKDLQSSPIESNLELRDFAIDFLETYIRQVGRDKCVGGSADVFYIPDLLKRKFTMATEIFFKRKCIVEIALYTMLFGISDQDKHVTIHGRGLWGKNRDKPWLFYNESNVFLHPFKFQKHMDNNTEGRTFYCDRFLKKYEDVFMNK